MKHKCARLIRKRLKKKIDYAYSNAVERPYNVQLTMDSTFYSVFKMTIDDIITDIDGGYDICRRLRSASFIDSDGHNIHDNIFRYQDSFDIWEKHRTIKLVNEAFTKIVGDSSEII